MSVFHRILALYLKENKKYCHYTSPAIQNEIISILAQITRGDIINEIKEAGIFSMMLDETSGVSKDEQLSASCSVMLCGERVSTIVVSKANGLLLSISKNLNSLRCLLFLKTFYS